MVKQNNEKMKEQQLKSISVSEYWNLLEKMPFPVVIMGTPGLCKTTLPQQVAESFGGQSCVIPVAQFSETGDMMGGIDTTSKEGKTVYLPPDIFPTEGLGFIVIDDFNRANTLITQSLLHFAQYQEFGSYKVPQIEHDKNGKWVSGYNIIFTGNPDDGEHCVNEVDNAFFTRALTYQLEFDKIMWGKWARNQEIDEKFITFILKNSQYINAKDNPRAFSNGFLQLKGCNDLDWIEFIMAGTGIDCYPMLVTWLNKEWSELDFDSMDVFNEKCHEELMGIFKNANEDGKTLFAERISTLNVQDLQKPKIDAIRKFFHLMKKEDEERFLISFIKINKECPDIADDVLFNSFIE